MRRPRIGNGIRRGLALLAGEGWTAFEDPTHPWKTLHAIERRELAGALAWIEWKRKHNEHGDELTLAPRVWKRRVRPPALEQIPIPFEACRGADLTGGD